MHAPSLAADIPLDRGVPELLARNRDALVRRWLTLVVERSSFEELSQRPLGERVRELDLFWEAAGGGTPSAPEARPSDAEPETPPDGPAAPVTPLFPPQ